ncbi:MAG: carboxypeptidase-like regulatory domain-containing protein, partial [Candidatus Cloacimonetes bacterium]|nr:carboxypeptidase-like regulatory domain-containing protein [Candidatus Cloacimonadota bacterium]
PEYPNRTMNFYSDTVDIDPANPITGYLNANLPNVSLILNTSGFATLSGTVSASGTPLANAIVTIDGTTRSATTNAQGEYELPYLTPGNVNITVSCQGYNDAHINNIALTADQTTTQNITMTPMTNITINGQVNNSVTGVGVEGVKITLDGYAHFEVLTNASGAFTIPQVFSGQTYTLHALKQAYVVHTQEVVVGTSDLTIPTISLVQGPSLIDAYVGNPATTTTTYSYPANFFYKSSLSQSIYFADEFSSDYYLGSGAAIASFKHFMTLAGNIPANKPLKVWMANTDINEFSSTTSWLPLSEFTLVFDGTVDLSASGAHELEFELDEPFIYEGNNLVVMIQRPLDDAYYSTTNLFKTTETTNRPNRTLYRQNDSTQQEPTDTAATGTRVSFATNAEFVFATAGFATLNGVVSSTNGPIEGARVGIVGTSRYVMTNSQGQYEMANVGAGLATIKASKFGFNDAYVENIELLEDQTTTQNITMTPMTNVSVSGTVVNSVTNAPIEGALVRLSGYETYEGYTNATGQFNITNVYSGQTYELKVLKASYYIYTAEAVVGNADTTLPTINLVQGEAMVDAYVGNPNSTTNAYYYPANFFYKSSITQVIYMAEEFSSDVYIGSGAPISAIKYFANLNGDIPANTPIKIWAANTELSSFATTTSWIPEDEFSLVFDGTLNLNMSGAQEIEIVFDEPFPYEGNNLVLMVLRPLDDGYYSSSNKWKNTSTPAYTNRTLYRMSDSENLLPGSEGTGSFASTVPNTVFTFSTSGFSTLTGVVTHGTTPLANARVSIVGTNRSSTTNAQGQYQINYAPAGTVDLKTTCQGYNDEYTNGVVLEVEETTVQNINMTPMTTISITGFVKNATTQAGIPAAEIRLYGYENYSVVSTNTGAFTFPAVYSGQTYTLKVLKPGYEFHSEEVIVGTQNITIPDIMVTQSPSIVETLVGDPNTTTANTYSYPINFFYKSSISQSLYFADELSDIFYLGAGTPITQITYNMVLGGNIPADKPIKIWMANTDKTEFTTTSDWLPQDEFTLVFDNTVDLSGSGAYEFSIELDEPFPYDGENLIIMIIRPLDDAYYSTTNLFKITSTPNKPNRTLYRQSDTVDQSLEVITAGTRVSNVPNTLFTFVTSGFATLMGNTTANNAPLAGVKVQIDGTNRFAISDAQGNYALSYVPAGNTSITASKHGYYDVQVNLDLEAYEVTTQNFNLTQLPNVTVTGQINGSDTS